MLDSVLVTYTLCKHMCNVINAHVLYLVKLS